MNKKDIKIAVIGAGAIGGVVGTMLAYNGFDVEISKRLDSEFVIIDNKVCMEVTGKFGNVSCLVPYVKNNNFTSKKDIIFLCVSAYNLDWCMKTALEQLTPNGVIVALQNVWSLDDLMASIPKNKLFLVYNDWNSVRLSGKDIHVYDAGHIHLGAITNSVDMPITTVASVLECISTVDIERDFIKFFVSRFLIDNALICMGALTGQTIAGYLGTKAGKKMFYNLIAEQVKIMQANKFDVVCLQSFDYNKFICPGLFGKMYRSKMYSRLIRQNGNVVSRLLRKLENNKKTEVDYYIHKMCIYAQKKDVSAPYCMLVDKMLHEIVNKERTICMDNIKQI